jgi:nucleoporin NUP82
MAIVTSHTVHVMNLPESRHLTSRETMIKPKCRQIGPTHHVLEGSPLASVLWHPLGHKGTCLVTVTTSAIVRLFELNTDASHSTFDAPTLAIDLKRLANATSREDAVRQQTFRESIGFSPDLVEMEVVSATFSNATTGWAPMTLWLAMKSGDVYALCPLLPPKKWQATPDHLKSLSIAITAKHEEHDDFAESQSEEEAREFQMQIDWYSDLCEQENTLEYSKDSTDPAPEQVFTCPTEPGTVPKLQGPFYLEPELDDLSDVTDLLVLGLKSSNPPLVDDDDEEEDYNESPDDYLPYSLICLLTSSGQVHVCLDLDGVEGKWLSSQKVRPERHFYINR